VPGANAPGIVVPIQFLNLKTFKKNFFVTRQGVPQPMLEMRDK